MNELWPWLVMLVGIVALFVHRYWTAERARHRLYAPTDYSADIRVLESRAPAPAREEVDPVPPPPSPEQTVSKPDCDLEKIEVFADVASARPMMRSSEVAIGHNWMPMAISLLVLLSALFVILSNNTYADAQQKWAFGVVGTILGYWFKR